MLGDLGLWGVLIGIGGTLFAVYAYFKTRTIKSASIWYKNSVLLADSGSILPKEVTIQFNGKPISHLKKMNIVFWNAGNVTIDKNDIVYDDPLRFALEGEFDVFKVSVAAETKPANGTKPGKSNAQKKEFPVEFTYLDSGQGLNLEVLYQGTLVQPVFYGTIKGIPGGFTDVINGGGNFLRRAIRSERTVNNIAAFFRLVGAVLIPVAVMYYLTEYVIAIPSKLMGALVVFVIISVGLAFLILQCFLIIAFWRRKFRPPDHLLV